MEISPLSPSIALSALEMSTQAEQCEKDVEQFLTGITPKRALGDISNHNAPSSPCKAANSPAKPRALERILSQENGVSLSSPLSPTANAVIVQEVARDGEQSTLSTASHRPHHPAEGDSTPPQAGTSTGTPRRIGTPRSLSRSSSSPLVTRALAVSSPKATRQNSPARVFQDSGKLSVDISGAAPQGTSTPTKQATSTTTTTTTTTSDTSSFASSVIKPTAFSLPQQVAMLSKALITSNGNLELCHQAIQELSEDNRQLKVDMERRLHLAKVARVRERTYQRVRIHRAKDHLQKQMQKQALQHHQVVTDLARELTEVRTLSQTDRSQYLEMEHRWQEAVAKNAQRETFIQQMTDALTNKAEEATDAMSEVQTKYESAQDTIKNLKSELKQERSNSDIACKQLTQQCDTLRSELAREKKVNEDLEQRLIKAEAATEHFQSKVENLEDEHSRHVSMVVEREDDVERLQATIRDLERQVVDKDTEIAISHEKCSHLESEVDSLKAKMNGEVKKATILVKRCDQLESEARKSSNEASFLATQKKTLESRLETELKRWQQMLESEIAKGQEQLRQASKESTVLTEKINVLEQSLHTEMLDSKALRQELAQAKNTQSREDAIAEALEQEKSLSLQREEANCAEIARLQSQLVHSDERSIRKFKPILLSLMQETKLLKAFMNDVKSELTRLPREVEHEMAEHEAQFHRALSASAAESDRLNKVQALRTAFVRERNLRRKLHNKLQELCGNIRVFCRIRPPTSEDERMELGSNDGQSIVDPNKMPLKVLSEEQIALKTAAGKSRIFSVDRVFDPSTSQQVLFEEVQPMLTSVLDGYNVCIMAYGQTGSGKTYTMQGTPESPGLIPRSIAELFSLMDERKEFKRFELQMTMVELYNEKVRDLLVSPEQQTVGKHDIVTNDKGYTTITGITYKNIDQEGDVEDILSYGHKQRSERSTEMNDTSSRSHCVVTVTVTGHDDINGTTSRAQLTLVDLAGSECVGKTGTVGEGLREAKNINRSLSALGDVLGALAKKKSHVPYRNSKLTTMLRDFLGGDAKMLLCVAVPPTKQSISETARAISFGVRAMQTERGQAQAHSD